MKNTGTFNADIIVMLAFCFFLPIFLSSIMNMYYKVTDLASGKRKKLSWFDTHDPFGFPKRAASTTVYSPPSQPLRNETTAPKTSPTSKEEAWDKIKEATLQKAMEGNGSARDWVTRHVFNTPRHKPKRSPTVKAAAKTPQTRKNPIIEDAVEALASVGFKKTDARARAESAVSKQNYGSVEDLIKDIMQN